MKSSFFHLRWPLLGFHGSYERGQKQISYPENEKDLIEHHGFNFISVEGDWPPCEQLNQYIQNRRGKNVFEALSYFTRWPTWMWANEEIVRLAEWMRNEVDVETIQDQQKREEQAQKLLGAVQQGASAAKDLGAAQASMAQAQPAAAAA